MTNLTPPVAATPAPATPDAAAAALTTTAPDPAAVQALAARIADGNLQSIASFGRELGRKVSDDTDALLSQVRASDLDAMGGKLGAIVSTAQSLNLHALSDQRSRIPLIGPWLDKLRMKKNDFMRNFQDVKTQVDTLINEVDIMQRGLADRVAGLDGSFESIRQEHALLALHVSAGEMAMAQLREAAAHLSTEAADPLQAQQARDLQQALQMLDKRLADLRVLQHAALQQLPMIRMVQANNRMLIDKFHSIKELTVPAWKRQFMLAISLNEQRNAVALADNIDDATNEFLRENARLLKDNTIATAKANQRLVIDIETLRETHDALISTVQEVMRINQQGAQERANASSQLGAMRESMVRQLGELR